MPYKDQNGQWVGQVRRNGTKRKKKGFLTKKEALQWEADWKRRPEDDWHEKTDTMCLGDWSNDYLDFARDRFCVKTYREKRALFRNFFKVVDPSQSTLTLRQVLAYLQTQNRERSGYAANKDRKNLVAAWNWGIKYLGLASPNPCLVDRFPEERRPRYIPPEKDFWTVYECTEGQDRVMLLTYLHLAARRTEIFRLRWEDVDFIGQQIRLATRKRRDGSLEYDWLPMTDELHQTLIAHRQENSSEWVFPNPVTGAAYFERKRWMRGLCKKAGVKPFGLHAIRYLTASILAEAGEPVRRIQVILRHKKLSTTERYLHQLVDLKSSLKILEKRGNVVYIGKQKAPRGAPSPSEGLC